MGCCQGGLGLGDALVFKRSADLQSKKPKPSAATKNQSQFLLRLHKLLFDHLNSFETQSYVMGTSSTSQHLGCDKGMVSARGKDPARANYRLKQTLEGHEKGIVCLNFSEGETAGKYLASASADRTIKIWVVSSGALLHTLIGHLKGLNDVAWDQSGRYIASASDDSTLRLWDVKSGKCLRILEGHTNFAFCCCFNPHGNMLVSGSHDETLKVWDVKSGTCIRSIPAHSDPVTSVEFNRDGSMILSSSFDGLCRLWDTETGKCLRTIIDELNPPVSMARFSPNGKFVLIGSLDGRLKLWDYEKQKHIKSYSGHRNSSHCLFACFIVTHPNGTWVLSGSEDNSVYVYDLNQQQVVQKLEGRTSAQEDGDGHCDMVLAVARHPAINMIASGGLSDDRTIKIWEDSLSEG